MTIALLGISYDVSVTFSLPPILPRVLPRIDANQEHPTSCQQIRQRRILAMYSMAALVRSHLFASRTAAVQVKIRYFPNDENLTMIRGMLVIVIRIYGVFKTTRVRRRSLRSKMENIYLCINM